MYGFTVEPEQAPQTACDVDLDLLAEAVAFHETSSCTKGSGVTHNNCFGIIRNGGFQWYNTKDESYEDFKQIWQNGYSCEYPTIAHARVYSGNDRSEIWLRNVTNRYNELLDQRNSH